MSPSNHHKPEVFKMSYDSSFTLCPSNVQSAFAFYDRGSKVSDNNKQNKVTESKTVSPQVDRSANSATKSDPVHAIHTRVVSEQQQLIPGTLLQDWMLPSHNLRRFQSSRSIRASPFEPLIHHRNLPKSGTISPLHVQEHGCVGQPHRIPVANSMSAPDSPPIAEIRIPTPQTLLATAGEDDVSFISNKEEADFKSLYLGCQQDLHNSQQQVADFAEENRLLKRQLIQLQRQLYASSRTKRPRLSVSWSVPESSTSNKRQRPSVPAEKP